MLSYNSDSSHCVIEEAIKLVNCRMNTFEKTFVKLNDDVMRAHESLSTSEILPKMEENISALITKKIEQVVNKLNPSTFATSASFEKEGCN